VSLEPGTVVESRAGVRGQVERDESSAHPSATSVPRTVEVCLVRWFPPSSEGGYVNPAQLDNLRVVPAEELNDDPLAPGPGW
jgi:hypothetical protein